MKLLFRTDKPQLVQPNSLDKLDQDVFSKFKDSVSDLRGNPQFYIIGKRGVPSYYAKFSQGISIPLRGLNRIKSKLGEGDVKVSSLKDGALVIQFRN